MDYQALQDAVAGAAAFRRYRRLQPVGGPGDKIFPPTYPVNGSPAHVFEVRRIGGEELYCVLVDSVQSQANRLEEALLTAATRGDIRLPRLVVSFEGSGINAISDISSLEAPHRIFDAILRDSELGGVPFRQSELGTRLKEANPADASAIFEASPTSLLFGVWNSTGEGGGLGAKFARAIVSEIFAVNTPVDEIEEPRTGEIKLRSAGRRTGSRIDPLGILRSVEVYKGPEGWDVKAGKGAKKVRPSEINHGNIAPSISELGVTCDYAVQTAVITLAGLRRLRFGADAGRALAAQAYIAALGLYALTALDREGYALRSRCDLVCEGIAPLELVAFDGSTKTVELSLDAATALAEAACDGAVAAGFDLKADPILLKPQDKLISIIQQSRQKALADEGGEGEDS